jgi:hypothetical protein
MKPWKFRVFAVLASSVVQAVGQLALNLRMPLFALLTFTSAPFMSAQTVDSSVLDFTKSTGTTSDGTALGAKADPKTALSAKISALPNHSILYIGGIHADQFTASLTSKAAGAEETTLLCSDADLKSMKCAMRTEVGTVPVVLTVNFTPDASGEKSAAIFYYTTAIEPPQELIELKGTGYCALARNKCEEPYSDCDEHSWLGFSLLGGFEQSYLSSQSNQTNAFVRAFTKASIPITASSSFNTWGVIRDLGAPAANSTQNLVSTISNPDGTVTSQSLSTVGYSVDFLVGVGFDRPIAKTQGQYSWGPILAVGATTPLSSSSAATGYKVPALGTEECSELQARFASPNAYKTYSPDLVAGNAHNCLYNQAGVAPGSSGTPVSTLAFAGINRSNFLEKYEVGVRTVFRTYADSKQTKCSIGNSCNRGIVDFTAGQDEAITGGVMRHFVFKVDGVQPFPYTGGYMYLFGTVALRSERNTQLPPLVLSPAAASDLADIPSAHVFVEPFKQPNKDFYRIGVGLSVDKLLKKKTT